MPSADALASLRSTFERATMTQRYRDALRAFKKHEVTFKHHGEFWGLYGHLLEFAAQQQNGAEQRRVLRLAGQYYKRATTLDPRSFLGWHGQWRLACQRRDTRCLSFFWKAHGVAPRQGHIKCLGISYLALGQPARAIPYFQTALRKVQMAHDKISIHFDLAIALQQLGLHGRARRHAMYAQCWFNRLDAAVRRTPAWRNVRRDIEKTLAACNGRLWG